MTSEPRIELVIFGSTGHLAQRKLFPALFRLYRAGLADSLERVVATGRTEQSSEAFRQQTGKQVRAATADAGREPGTWADFEARIHYQCLDAGQRTDFLALRPVPDTTGVIRIYYLATLPSLYGTICEQLGEAGLVNRQCRVALEKPLGHDLHSCREINRQVQQYFPESAIFRIDHYLGKESVQNLLALRFGNSFFPPLWDSRHIDNVQITVAESIGIEGRVDYYTSTGALRDMVQNHMLQMLCMVALEPPPRLTPDFIRDEKIKVLDSLVPMSPEKAPALTVRGCYTAGAIDGGPVPGFAEEAGDRADENLETFVALRVDIESFRWAQVPFYLRTGKRLARGYSEIAITFRKHPFSLFPNDPHDQENRLVIGLQPEDTMTLHMVNKLPGLFPRLHLQPTALDLTSTHGPQGEQRHDAYEKLLLDLFNGDQTFFMRGDETEAAWRWTDTVIEAWRWSRLPVRPYAAGTMGPESASALIERDGRSWHE